MKRAWLAAAAAVALAVGGWVYWKPAAPPPAAKAAESRPQPVMTRAAETRPVPVQVTAVGNVLPLATVAIKPRVEGEILKVAFQEGVEVRQGDLLFTLDARAAEVQRRQAEANLTRDRAQLDKARADLVRYTTLSKTGDASKQKLEDAQSTVGALDGSLKSDQAAIDAAQLNIAYATIRAPVEGRTGAILQKQGNIAKAGDSLVTITQMRPITVAFSVPETNLAAIREATRAAPLAVAAMAPGEQAPAVGRLTFIDSAIDKATGTIALKATFANDDQRLWPGQFVNVTLTLGTDAAALTIPAEAVQTGQSGTYVFVATPDNVAELRPVTVARTYQAVAVVSKGVQPGERVVVDGILRIANGTKLVEGGAKPAQPQAEGAPR